MTTLVNVETFADYPEALAARSFLEAYGIPVFIPDWYTASNAWHLTNALQGVRLWTYKTDVAAARALLDSHHSKKTTAATYLTPADVVIAACAFFIAGIPHPVRRRTRSN